MWTRQRADAVDTRIVYWAYAALAWLAGFLLVAWGPMWLGGGTAAELSIRASVIRVIGSMLVAAGCFSSALATVPDPVSRRRGLLWLASGHAVILVVVLLQRDAVWSPLPAELPAAVLNCLLLVFVYLWQFTESELVTPRSPLTSLFGRSDRGYTDRLRSQYEEQIRQAASREERSRLARELHDSIKQQIFVVQTAAATAQVRFDEDPAAARSALDEVRGSAREAMAEMEAMLDQLRAAPLENTGLVEALKRQCEALGFRTGAKVDFRIGKLPATGALPPGAHQAIFRVAQEALANIGRHARAQNVSVTLDTVNAGLTLSVRDDGQGFDSGDSARGMGIANMRARAEEFGGTFSLNTQPGGGTRVTFSIPGAVQTPFEYRQRAMMWGVLLLIQLVAAVWSKSMLIASWGILCGLAFLRETIAWLRTRRQSEAM
jgi:signal transduction histidine kinase